MSEIQRVCGTARVSYMCACGDGDVLEPCCCFVSARGPTALLCALESVCQNAQTPGHVSPDLGGASLSPGV